MNELEYILRRILWISQNRDDDDTYAEICDWIKRMENEITWNDSDNDNWFITHLAKKLEGIK